MAEMKNCPLGSTAGEISGEFNDFEQMLDKMLEDSDLTHLAHTLQD